MEDEGLGEELSVVWELEPGVACLEKAQLPALKDFDAPRVFDAFLDAVTWGAVSSADDKALQAPFRSGVEVEDYQLDPVVRALSMPRVNLLVADDVGLGKTIEAGLVAQELILRHRARSVLIVGPSSVQVQWKEEMRDKFGLEFRIVDSDLFADLRRRRGIHVNPWSHFPRLITSIDFLKRERPTRLFRETLPAGDRAPFPRPYDLLIVDEAHNVARPAEASTRRIRSEPSRFARLPRYFEHKLFLTATPHNGIVNLLRVARSCLVKSTPPIVLSRRTSPHPIQRTRECGADGGEPIAGGVARRGTDSARSREPTRTAGAERLT